jgi:hypothetical protein
MYDLKCTKCDKKGEDLVWDDDFPLCDLCGAKMEIAYSNKFTFKLLYDNKKDVCGWGGDGYATSQYYRQIKEQEAATGVRHKAHDADYN